MKETTVGDRCGHAWKVHGLSKPANNQVVEMSYTYTMHGRFPPDETEQRPYFLVENCGVEDVIGGYMASGRHGGKVAFAHAMEPTTLIRWEGGRWTISTSSSVFLRQVHYINTRDTAHPPADGWLRYDPTTGDGGDSDLPTLKWPTVYHLSDRTPGRNSSYECVSAAEGKSFDINELRCMRDVGPSCVGPINKYSKLPRKLWKRTMEYKIWKLRGVIDEGKTKLKTADVAIDRALKKLQSRIMDPESRAAYRVRLQHLQDG